MGGAVDQLKAARAELAASRAFLQHVLTVVPDAIVVADVRGRIQLANLAASQITGRAPEALVGRHLLGLLTPDDRGRARQLFREDASAGAGEYTVLSPLGARLVAVEWALLQESDSHDTRVVLAGKDITDRRKNERLLELENTLLTVANSDVPLTGFLESLCLAIESLLPGALCSILLLDEAGRHLLLGAAPSLPAAYNHAIDGVAIGPAVGSCGTAAYSNRTVIVRDIAHDPLWQDYKDTALRHGLQACWSTPIQSASGHVLGTFAIYHRTPNSPVPFDLQAITRAAHLASMAIQRKRSEDALRRSEARLQEITAALGEGVYVLDAEGRVTFVNPEMERLLGWPAEELLGREGHALFHHRRPDGSQIAHAECPTHATLRTGLTQRSGEDWFVRKDGSLLPVALVSSPILHNGKITGAVAAFQDITERRLAQQALRTAAHYARSLIEASLDPLVTISPEGKITDVNRASEEATGVDRTELIGTDFADYFTSPELARAGYQRVLEQGFVRDYPLTLRHRDGRTADVLYNATVYRDEDGTLLGVFAAARDITERKKAEQLIQQLAYFDTLTNLPNRRLLLDRLNHALAQSRRYQRAMALLFLDLDHFKEINDTLGHDAGDELLQAVAARLNTCVRSSDTVSRQGGDEFVIVLAEIPGQQDAERIAGKIIEAVGQPVAVKGHALTVTTSIGITFYPGYGDAEIDDLMKQADQAMYEAKRSGRNRYHCHST